MKTENAKVSKGRKIRKVKHHRACPLCKQGILHVDYKDVELLNHYIANNGRILPRRITGLCAKHQKAVANAIKRARIVALMPFVKE